MDWKDIIPTIEKYAPMVAGIIGGPAIGTGVSLLETALGLAPGSGTPDTITAAVSGDPTSALKLKQMELDYNLAKLKEDHAQTQEELKAANLTISTINTTMIEELRGSKDEEWYQKAWRPACGFCVALGSFIPIVAMCGIFYSAIQKDSLVGALGTVLNVIPQLALSIATLLAVPGAAVGIAAWHRGMAQREQITTNGSGSGSIPDPGK